jgi:hypothetical protein
MKILILLFAFFFFYTEGKTQEKKKYKLENPVTVAWLKTHLKQNSPKLILTPEIEKNLLSKLETDQYLKNYYAYLLNEADGILKKPLLKHELEGFRLLAVSRQMVERMGVLCMVYRINRNPEILKRIDEEVKTVCAFEDWNPQHFLDIAEMSFAVAIAVDWAGSALPAKTVVLAKKSLIEKGIKPSYNEAGPRMFWIDGTNNWNSVCHGGMIAASIVTANLDPELAAKTIARALDKLPNSLQEYAPDGVYPEGPTYWGYGTSYAIIAANSLTTALGSDFGIAKSTGFMQSALFRMHVTGPSGEFFNFADSGDKKEGDDAVILSWFAAKTGDALFFDRSFFEKPSNAGRLAGPGMVWLSEYTELKKSGLPPLWCGKGINPVAVFRGGKDDPGQFYLAVKGGQAQISHGNMDAGTFVFDLNGVRWVTDPGNQNYYLLNRINFNLSGLCQNCPRWTLLTKSNRGHSTVVVNDERFNVDGNAPITGFKEGEQPECTIDMTALYGNSLSSMNRRFIKESNNSVLIEDKFKTTDSTRLITWGLMTSAEVIPVQNGAVLRKDGKQLNLSILSPTGIQVTVISLDPPPMEIDKTIKNLKRIEIRIPAWTVEKGEGIIRIRLSDKKP